MKKKSVKILLCVMVSFGFFSLAENSKAETKTINVVNLSGQPSCEQVDVQRTLSDNNTIAGDTVSMPAKSCTWNSGLIIDKGIILIGAGIDKTVLVNNVPTTTLMIRITATSQWRLSNLTINGNYKINTAGNLKISSSPGWWELDNVKFINSGSRHLSVETSSPGIIHNCFFQDSGGQAIWLKGANSQSGTSAWDEETRIGDSSAIFVEDNIFYNSTVPHTAFDSEWGVKVVFRYNNLTNSYWLNHGCENGRSAVWIEAYENDILLTVPNSNPVQTRRGGTGVTFNNVISLQGDGRSSWQVFVLNDYCSKGGGLYYNSGSVAPKIGDILIGALSGDVAVVLRESAPSSGDWISGNASGIVSVKNISNNFNIGENVNIQRGAQFFMNAMTTRDSGYADGALNYNCCEWEIYKEDCTEYPCLDQVGRTYNQILEPFYHWNNYYDGFLKSPYVHIQGDTTSDGIFGCADAIQKNRDYYDGVLGVQTSKGVPFDGTSGVGWGTLINRPDSCTSGVGYWATDEGEWNSKNSISDGEFYQCNSGGDWELHYTPYSYPHLLRSDLEEPPADTISPSNPTGLSVK